MIPNDPTTSAPLISSFESGTVIIKQNQLARENWLFAIIITIRIYWKHRCQTTPFEPSMIPGIYRMINFWFVHFIIVSVGGRIHRVFHTFRMDDLFHVSFDSTIKSIPRSDAKWLPHCTGSRKWRMLNWMANNCSLISLHQKGSMKIYYCPIISISRDHQPWSGSREAVFGVDEL